MPRRGRGPGRTPNTPASGSGSSTMAWMEVVPMVLGALPAIAHMFTSASSSRQEEENKKVQQMLEIIERQQGDMEAMRRDQVRIMEGLMLLMERMSSREPSVAQNRPGITIHITPPENPEAQDRFLSSFTRELSTAMGAAGAIGPPTAPCNDGDSSDDDTCNGQMTGLECGVCSRAYNTDSRRPLCLPVCGHTFCRTCLRRVESNASVPCPGCRQVTLQSVNSLQTNFALLDLVNDSRHGGGACGRDSTRQPDDKLGKICQEVPTSMDEDEILKKVLEQSRIEAEEQQLQNGRAALASNHDLHNVGQHPTRSVNTEERGRSEEEMQEDEEDEEFRKALAMSMETQMAPQHCLGACASNYDEEDFGRPLPQGSDGKEGAKHKRCDDDEQKTFDYLAKLEEEEMALALSLSLIESKEQKNRPTHL